MEVLGKYVPAAKNAAIDKFDRYYVFDRYIVMDLAAAAERTEAFRNTSCNDDAPKNQSKK